MKKRLAVMTLCLVMLAGCSSDQDVEDTNTTIPSQESEVVKENENEAQVTEARRTEESSNSSQTVDGITISVDSFSTEPYEDDQGEYTKRIIMNFTIQNQTDTTHGYITTWSGKLEDGTELKSWTDIMSMDLKQVAPGGSETDTAYFLIDDTVDPDKIIVSYDFQDYGEEYWDDFGKIMSGEMSQEEYTSKYGDYKELVFTSNKK